MTRDGAVNVSESRGEERREKGKSVAANLSRAIDRDTDSEQSSTVRTFG